MAATAGGAGSGATTGATGWTAAASMPDDGGVPRDASPTDCGLGEISMISSKVAVGS